MPETVASMLKGIGICCYDEKLAEEVILYGSANSFDDG
jgi:hypothetical protein